MEQDSAQLNVVPAEVLLLPKTPDAAFGLDGLSLGSTRGE